MLLLLKYHNALCHSFFASGSFLIGLLNTIHFQGDSTSFITHKTHHGAAAPECSSNARAPCFARPARAESASTNSVVQPMAQEPGYDFSTLDPPAFSRPSKHIGRGDQLCSQKKTCYPEIGG